MDSISENEGCMFVPLKKVGQCINFKIKINLNIKYYEKKRIKSGFD